MYKILDSDKVLIFKANGEAWILEKGIGCLSLDFYEGRSILIYSPGLFAGVGSKIMLPDNDQECRIWSNEFLGINPTIIESQIDGTFEGWGGDTIFQLTNGQIWQQVSYSHTRRYIYSPRVIIYSTGDGFKMMVEGVSQTIYVRRPIVIESQIDGTFEGWDGDTKFQLKNGQIWQQVSYSYTYHYAYSPRVIIYSTGGGFKMMVEGMSQTIYVRRLDSSF